MRRSRPITRSGRTAAASGAVAEAAGDESYSAGATAQAQGDAARAAALFRICLGQDPRHVEAWTGLGAVLKDQGDFEGAEKAYRSAIALQPGLSAGYGGLADICLRQGKIEQALDHCGKAVILGRLNPKASYYITAARALSESGRHAEALEGLAIAMRLEPVNPDAYFELGLIHEDQGRPLAAFEAYQTTILHRPKDVRAYNNMASILITLGQLELAIATARMAAALAPRHPDVYLNLATALRLHGDDAEATAVYETIIALQPDHGEALVELSHRRQHACDWDGLLDQQEAAWANSYRKGRIVSPFIVMTASASPVEQLRCARVWGDHLAKTTTPLALRVAAPMTRANGKIRLGYLSADFHSHATAMLIAGMLEEHDKSRFETYAYSLGPDDGSPMRHRLVEAFDHFIDLRNQADQAAAQRIHDDQIDILLDLKGYTQDARIKILAYRPAPVQVNYLGFPGTMGAPFIDYIVTDPIVTPMDHQPFFAEKIVQLPHCYQPNDKKRSHPGGSPGRVRFGLPANGFVFCSFNSPYKITPPVFDIWMRLLRENPGSVLWLLAPKARAAENLRREASIRGIDPGRLVFAPFVPPEDHLARLGAADLFLDTLPVNAHTTASEALWVGLPIVTCAGETFASRVASSLVHAAGVPELATDSLEAYENLAMTLARNPPALAALGRRLRDNLLTAPLFDTLRYTRNFEQALLKMHEMRQSGSPAQPFKVGDRTE